MKTYQHTQHGRWIMAAMVAMSLAFAALGAFICPTLFIAAPMPLLCGWLFQSLTIEVDNGQLRWRFGPGLTRRQVRLEEISTVARVRTNVIEGWGIHLSRFGCLYNVSGFDAVAITLKCGRRFALGTDEAPVLLAALRPEAQGPLTSLDCGLNRPGLVAV